MLIKAGHVIDAKNNIDEVMDIAIKEGKIAAVGKNIDPKLAKLVIDANGKYVTPGLIDIHGHVLPELLPMATWVLGVGAGSLPFNTPVEIEMIVELK